MHQLSERGRAYLANERFVAGVQPRVGLKVRSGAEPFLAYVAFVRAFSCGPHGRAKKKNKNKMISYRFRAGRGERVTKKWAFLDAAEFNARFKFALERKTRARLADPVSESLLTGVHVIVFLQMSQLSETLAAGLALERPFTRVSSQMHFQV